MVCGKAARLRAEMAHVLAWGGLWTASPHAVAQMTPVVHEVVQQPRVVVTGTREKALLDETPASVGTVDAETIRRDRPTHPSQVMGQVPGVAVSVTSGEGHATAIRQPFTTNPVYLFLEDGIPIRSTGFFNHNALYEINLPAAGGIEVIRGPGTALYGSDAIGGIVNVLSASPPFGFEAYAAPDVGPHGWRRLQGGVGDSYGASAWRTDLNLTHTDGWREATRYDRQSGALRWDSLAGSGNLKTVLAFSRIDQQTGANSPLVEVDYRDTPTRNYLPIAYRKVDALRLSSAWERESGNDLLSLTPYLRHNRMELLASFLLNSDPTVSNTENSSLGLLAKWRRDFPDVMRARVIVGADVDYSPGRRREDRLNVAPTGTGASRVFSTYGVGPRVYDYDVSFRGLSPYFHGELSPIERLRIVAGIRHDALSYRFDNAQAAASPIQVPGAFPGLRFYGQASDGTKEFRRTSPKLGATFDLGAGQHLFVSHNRGFRAPSEGQIYRPSAATSAAGANALRETALALQPIRATQDELGLRGHAGSFTYDVVAYQLVKRDDILTFRDNTTNFTQSVNAGRTSHEGVELGIGWLPVPWLRADVSWSHARHRYEDWATSGGDFTGNEIEAAPRTLANLRLQWLPREGSRIALEVVKIGEYWMDAANTVRYPGHALVNLRANWQVSRQLELYASVTNLADRHYADSASISSSTPVYSPGLPRNFSGGVRMQW